ncbi:hypothetical protein EL22_07180 [Halostagnicola sp. A56]|uniref:hypothetical protein n=1 Tax=Halostagnicola sp. A56 TaxID=1495067 RepID=UPI0004A00EA7|nr:hypothetical protein [Halostagnicola sp. A56]KDE58096.1 hypothetical protein EL22_07180 [Halostagnicola sp. A56]
MKRRTFMIGAGGIGAATMGSLAFAGTAAAEVEAGLFSVENEHFDTNSGRLERLELADVTVFASWEGFSHPVEAIDWTLEATVDGGGFESVGTTDVTFDEPDEYEGDASSTSIERIDLVEEFGQETFEVNGDESYEEDATEQFDVEFRVTATVTDVDGNAVEESVTGGSTVGITNLGAEVNVGGEGDIDGEQEVGTEYGPIETMDGVEAWTGRDPFTVDLVNTNPYPVIATAEWIISDDTKHELEAGEERTVTSPLLSSDEIPVRSSAQSEADAAETKDEFVGLGDVEEAD